MAKRKARGRYNTGKSMRPRRLFVANRSQRPRVSAGRGGELKFFDQAISFATPSSSGTIFSGSMNPIVQGASEVNRIGRKCTVKRVDARFILQLAGDEDVLDSSDLVRIIVYLDKQANGAIATTLGLLESADLLSFNNLEENSRFRRLMDKTFLIQAGGGGLGADAAAKKSVRCFKYIKWGMNVNIPLEFSGAAGVIGEVRSNNLGFLAISLNDKATLSSETRIRFTG